MKKILLLALVGLIAFGLFGTVLAKGSGNDSKIIISAPNQAQPGQTVRVEFSNNMIKTASVVDATLTFPSTTATSVKLFVNGKRTEVSKSADGWVYFWVQTLRPRQQAKVYFEVVLTGKTGKFPLVYVYNKSAMKQSTQMIMILMPRSTATPSPIVSPTNAPTETNTPTETDTSAPTATITAKPTETSTETPEPTWTSTPTQSPDPVPYGVLHLRSADSEPLTAGKMAIYEPEYFSPIPGQFVAENVVSSCPMSDLPGGSLSNPDLTWIKYLYYVTINPIVKPEGVTDPYYVTCTITMDFYMNWKPTTKYPVTGSFQVLIP